MKRRWLLLPFLVFWAFAVLAVIGFKAAWWWVEVHTGTVHEAGPYYGFWSGFGSDIGEGAIIAAIWHGVYLHWSHIKCHECWWIARYPLAGGAYKVCVRHHPEHRGVKPTLVQIHEDHRNWKAGTPVSRARVLRRGDTSFCGETPDHDQHVFEAQTDVGPYPISCRGHA